MCEHEEIYEKEKKFHDSPLVPILPHHGSHSLVLLLACFHPSPPPLPAQLCLSILYFSSRFCLNFSVVEVFKKQQQPWCNFATKLAFLLY